jgi:hypothetical protein
MLLIIAFGPARLPVPDEPVMGANFRRSCVVNRPGGFNVIRPKAAEGGISDNPFA